MKRTLAWLAVLAGVALPTIAQEFRAIAPIRAPRVALPAGAVRVSPPIPVPREVVEAAVERITASWNTPALEQHLSAGFYDRNRLLDTLNSSVPRDAKLRVLGIQAVQLLDQYRVPAGRDRPIDAIVSQVSVTVRTQVEFNEPSGTFRRLDGTNELIIEIPEPAP